MSDQYGRAGKTAVVTGASSGIGAAACRHLREAGWHTVGLARRSSSSADISFHVDVTDPIQVEQAFAAVPAPGLIVHSAGVIGPIAPVAAADATAWADAIAVDLVSVFHVLRFGLPRMLEGLVVHITSGAATGPAPWLSAYCAAKAGAEHLVRVAAVEADGSRIGVCALNPGITETPMQRDLRESDYPNRQRHIDAFEHQTGRTPDQVAAEIVRLSTEDPASLNGRTVSMSG